MASQRILSHVLSGLKECQRLTKYTRHPPGHARVLDLRHPGVLHHRALPVPGIPDTRSGHPRASTSGLPNIDNSLPETSSHLASQMPFLTLEIHHARPPLYKLLLTQRLRQPIGKKVKRRNIPELDVTFLQVLAHPEFLDVDPLGPSS